MFTDASLDQSSGLAAYAVWAKESGVRYVKAEMFKRPFRDSNLAEGAAIVNGLVFVLNTIRPMTGAKILVQTDSLAAIGAMLGTNRNEMFREIVGHRNRLLAGRGIHVDYIHVKGHRGTSTPRNAVNTWCDRACRQVLREHQATLVAAS